MRAISEVCCQFLDERVPCGGLDGTAQTRRRQRRSEDGKFDDELCASDERQSVRADAESHDESSWPTHDEMRCA